MKKLLLLVVLFCLFACARAQTSDTAKHPPLPANGADPDNGAPLFFATVTQPPLFPGGMDSVHRYISKRMLYPPELLKAHKGGKLVMSFVVEADGSINGLKAAQSPDARFTAAAIKAMQGLHFINGIENGRAVSVALSIVLRFDPDYPDVF